MILVDTSVWVDHFAKTDAGLQAALFDELVAVHPFVIGELACGNLKNRGEILALLANLPQSETVEPDEVLAFIEHHNIFGKGLGLIDVHLLSSCLLSGFVLWTRDKRLRAVAQQFNIAYVSL